MKTAAKTAVRWIVMAILLASASPHAANVSPKAAAGNAFNLSLDSANVFSGTVSVIGTQDNGGGLDGVVLRCQLLDGATQLASQVGSSAQASVPVGSQQDVPFSCPLSPAQLSTFLTAGSYLYVALEQGGNTGKVITRSPGFYADVASSLPARFVGPKLNILQVTKQGNTFIVTGEYHVFAFGVTSPPYTASYGWSTTRSPIGSSIPLGSLPLTQSPGGGNAVRLDAGTFTATIDVTGATGLGGAVSLYVSLPGAPTVIANISFPTALACGATAQPQSVSSGQPVTLTATCQNNVGPLQVEWRDAANVVVGTGANLVLIPAGTGAKQYTATVTDQVATTISAQGIKLTTAPVSVTVSAVAAPSGCAISAAPASLPVGGGSVTLTASCTGGDPATAYTWTGPGVASQTTALVTTSITATAGFTVVASNAGGSAASASTTVAVAAPPPPAAGISNQSGNPPPSNPGSSVPLAVKVVDAQGNPVSTAQLTTSVTGGNGALTLLTPQPANGVYIYDFLLGSDTSTRTVKLCLANSTSTCATFAVSTVDIAIITPAQQVIAPQAATAVSTPTIQINNIRLHLDQIRSQRTRAVMQALRLSVDGRPLPPLDAFALAPAGRDGKPAIGGGARADAAAKGGGAAADKPEDAFARWGAFINGDVDIGKQSAIDTQTGFKLTSKGLTLGGDYRFEGEHVLGAALGLLKADTNLDGNLGSQEAKGYSLSVFGSYVPAENAYADLIVNLGHNTYDSQRQQTAGGQATSNTSGNQFAVALSAGWNFTQGALTANPFGRVEYVDAKVNGFTESGNPDETLTVSEQRVKATTLTLGGQVSYALSTSWGVLLPYARLELQYLAQSNAQNVTAQLVGVTSPATIVPTLGEDKTFGNFSAGASAILPHGVSCFFNYQQLFGKDNFRDQKYTLGLRMEF